MESIQQLLATGDMPMREDGTIDLTELARMSLEDMVNQIMDIQADELCGEGNRRNGYRERRLVTPVGEIVMRVPKLREGTYFPDELIRPYSRVDRAMIAVVREVYVRGLSTRKIERDPQDREGRRGAGVRVPEPLARVPHDGRPRRGGRCAGLQALRRHVVPVPVA